MNPKHSVQQGSSGSEKIPVPFLSRVMAVSATLSSVLQGGFFVLNGRWTAHAVLAVGIAAANVFFAYRFLSSRSRLLFGGVLALYGAQFVIFVAKYIHQEPPFSLRLLQAAVAASFACAALSFLLGGLRIMPPVNAVLLCYSLAIGMIIGEAVLGVQAVPGDESPPVPEWQGNVVNEHPTLGVVYRPHSYLKTYYPDNPRGYFTEEDGVKSKMWLYVAGQNEARLEFPPERPDVARIEIFKAEAGNDYDIQLNIPKLGIRKNRSYRVDFRARADRSRNIGVEVALSREPGSSLGLHETIGLTPDWREFHEAFVSNAGEDNSRIHFDVGASDVPVEISGVELRDLSDNRVVEPDIPPKRYFVGFRFNALGCRGRDFEIPAPEGTFRILALGDSYTMGYGVHEEDNFPNRLEGLLNEKAGIPGGAEHFEAISCGVSGYGTHEERLFYELYGEKYRPDLVLLVMVFNDDIAYTEEIKKGYVNRVPGKAEHLFFIWGRIQDLAHRRPAADFSGSVREILALDSDVRKDGARLAVVIFRMNPDFAGEEEFGKLWNRLTDTVTNGLRESDIPVLVLGEAFFEKFDYDELTVHPLDGHPNEIAHGIAAREIRDFLENESLLKSRGQ